MSQPWIEFTEDAKALTTVDTIEHAFVGLGAEAGEVQGELQKAIYKERPIDKGKVALELGDMFFYASNVIRLLGLNFEDILAGNIEKLEKRRLEKALKETGQLPGQGRLPVAG